VSKATSKGIGEARTLILREPDRSPL